MIEGNSFNKKSLGGPNLNDLSRFKKYAGYMYSFQKAFNETGKPPYSTNKVQFHLRPVDINEAEFERQILRRLNG